MFTFQSHTEDKNLENDNQKRSVESFNINSALENTQGSFLQNFNNSNFSFGSCKSNISQSSMFSPSNILAFNEYVATAASLINNCNGYANSLESHIPDIPFNICSNASSSIPTSGFMPIHNSFGTTKLPSMSVASYMIDSIYY